MGPTAFQLEVFGGKHKRNHGMEDTGPRRPDRPDPGPGPGPGRRSVKYKYVKNGPAFYFLSYTRAYHHQNGFATRHRQPSVNVADQLNGRQQRPELKGEKERKPILGSFHARDLSALSIVFHHLPIYSSVELSSISGGTQAIRCMSIFFHSQNVSQLELPVSSS
jgi:hypothetical protein